MGGTLPSVVLMSAGDITVGSARSVLGVVRRGVYIVLCGPSVASVFFVFP